MPETVSVVRAVFLVTLFRLQRIGAILTDCFLGLERGTYEFSGIHSSRRHSSNDALLSNDAQCLGLQWEQSKKRSYEGNCNLHGWTPSTERDGSCPRKRFFWSSTDGRAFAAPLPHVINGILSLSRLTTVFLFSAGRSPSRFFNEN